MYENRYDETGEPVEKIMKKKKNSRPTGSV